MGLLRKTRAETSPVLVPDPPGTIRRTVLVSVDPVRLPGQLLVPPDATGCVIIAGEGSSPTASWSAETAEALNHAGVGSLRCDLLTPTDVAAGHDAEDVELIARRLRAAIRWLATWPDVGQLPVGVVGTGLGAAGALVAAAQLRSEIAAAVSLDGRPDLAGPALDRVSAPTLLIVGDRAPDRVLIHRAAERRLGSDSRLELVPGAEDLLEALADRSSAIRAAVEWFTVHLAQARRARSSTLAGLLH